MPEWALFKDFGPSFIALAAVGVALWRAGKAVSRKFLGDEKTPGLVDRWYEDERKRWDALCDSFKTQQVLCDSHGKVIVGHDRQMRAAAIEACAMCRAIAEQELPNSAVLVAKHCDEIERIIGEA